MVERLRRACVGELDRFLGIDNKSDQLLENDEWRAR